MYVLDFGSENAFEVQEADLNVLFHHQQQVLHYILKHVLVKFLLECYHFHINSFNRLKNKEVKIRRITDPDLLKINWGVSYAGEKEVQKEDDNLPPQPEDSTIFFNSCSRVQVL